MTEEQSSSAFDAFQEAVDLAGGQVPFSREIGTSQQNVSYWLKQRKLLPAEYVLRAESAYGISRHRLRPDIYPLEQDAA